MNKKRFTTAVLLSWLIFLMIDFILHASLLAKLWQSGYPALKSLKELALLIPTGYLSFLILTILVCWIYLTFYREDPGLKQTIKFGVVFGGLFSAANMLGLYSYIELPVIFILLINIGYFIEFLILIIVIRYIFFAENLKMRAVRIVFLFFTGLIIGVVLQNISNVYQSNAF
ncbi:hypothetical protein ACFL6G_05385 [candidate division KSB1 bacterium]